MTTLKSNLFAVALSSALSLGVFTFGAWAQSLDFGADGSDGNVEVEAENGIEWRQDEQVILARGNARAKRGRVTILADELRAYYKEKQTGGSDIWRLDADGNVRIVTPGEKASGELAVYDIAQSILVLSGAKVKFETANDVITADQQLEYWEKRKMAVARKNAVAVRDDKRIKADVLVAYFRDTKQGETEVHRIEAFDNVHIRTKKDKVWADRGVYNVKSGIATLTGSVKLERGKNKLNGCKAVVNLNTGVSKLYGCQNTGTGRPRVSGTLQHGNVKRK